MIFCFSYGGDDEADVDDDNYHDDDNGVDGQ